ncbi:MAG: hypothetical protein IKC59_05150 [Clostridia bacterium]|nr:hypothetical protein [Clostridia bacterium]
MKLQFMGTAAAEGMSVNYKGFCETVHPLGFEVSYDGKILDTTQRRK